MASWPVWLSSRRWISALTLGALTMFLIVFYHETILASPKLHAVTSSNSNPDPKSDANLDANPQVSLMHQQASFWPLFRRDLDAFDPKTDLFDQPHDGHLDIFFNASEQRARPNLLSLTEAQQNALRDAHAGFVDKIRQQQYRLPYEAGTRGIVTTAGGPLIPVALVSIRMLRESGSNLPVELFLSNRREWDPMICDSILPSLNAKCVVLQDIFDYDDGNFSIDKYQYKIMSVILSSFEQVLFLDSDCFPAHNPDILFESDPFKSTGLVLWPDFWFPSESPYFFDIAGIPAPAVNEKRSTESGVLLYNKRDHELSLLLATYYNYYGPSYYYSLQSQGNAGEGDKETFFWAAVVFHEPYYAVKTTVRALGYHTKSHEWRGSAMVQSDPSQEYHMTSKELDDGLEDNSKRPRPFFIHVNFPKLDPGQIFDYSSFGSSGPTHDSDGTARRIWHSNEEDATSFFGFDLEKKLWRIVVDIACEYEHDFLSWSGKSDVCLKAENYWNAVFENSG